MGFSMELHPEAGSTEHLNVTANLILSIDHGVESFLGPTLGAEDMGNKSDPGSSLNVGEDLEQGNGLMTSVNGPGLFDYPTQTR